MFKLIFIFAISLSGSVCQARQNFTGYKVYRLNPTTELQNELLNKLTHDDVVFDFWSDVNKVGLPVDVMVQPGLQRNFVDLMKEYNIKSEVLIEDIQSMIEEEIVETNARGTFGWTSYYTLEDIYTWMESLQISHPNVVTVLKAGSTYQSRDIKAVKVSYGQSNRSVFIEGGMHAREWISPATVTYILNELLNSQDPNVRQIAESFDWYIVPVSNPDGYVYTHTYNRLWRKTRSGWFYQCKGADPNRNWDYQWGKDGTSTNRCSDIYGGPSPFSEPETSSLADFISKVANTLDAYLAFHSYSQLMLIPYGHTEEHLDNYDEILEIGQKAALALEKRYGTKYKVGNVAETIYRASGSSMDWVKGTFNVAIAYTYELRDTGKHGFVLPAEQIIPNCEEVMDSLITIFQQAAVKGIVHLKQNKTEEHY